MLLFAAFDYYLAMFGSSVGHVGPLFDSFYRPMFDQSMGQFIAINCWSCVAIVEPLFDRVLPTLDKVLQFSTNSKTRFSTTPDHAWPHLDQHVTHISVHLSNYKFSAKIRVWPNSPNISNLEIDKTMYNLRCFSERWRVFHILGETPKLIKQKKHTGFYHSSNLWQELRNLARQKFIVSSLGSLRKYISGNNWLF